MEEVAESSVEAVEASTRASDILPKNREKLERKLLKTLHFRAGAFRVGPLVQKNGQYSFVPEFVGACPVTTDHISSDELR